MRIYSFATQPVVIIVKHKKLASGKQQRLVAAMQGIAAMEGGNGCSQCIHQCPTDGQQRCVDCECSSYNFT